MRRSNRVGVWGTKSPSVEHRVSAGVVRMARPLEASDILQPAATPKHKRQCSGTLARNAHATLSTHPFLEGMQATVWGAPVASREHWRRSQAAWSPSRGGCCQNCRDWPTDTKQNAPNLTHKRARPQEKFRHQKPGRQKHPQTTHPNCNSRSSLSIAVTRASSIALETYVGA